MGILVGAMLIVLAVVSLDLIADKKTKREEF